MPIWELLGLIFGLLAVIFLIKENILTWPAGIAYVLVSFVVFWRFHLYGDFILHIIFLILNVYGWSTWLKRGDSNDSVLQVTTMSLKESSIFFAASAVGIFLFSKFLQYLPSLFEAMEPASLPFWDSTTSILSVTGIYLQAHKKIENWIYWFAVDVLATGIYWYKGMYLYSILYFIYIFLAIAGWREWRSSLRSTKAT